MTGADPLSRRDSMMLSPISPGFTPSTDITHTVTPVQEQEGSTVGKDVLHKHDAIHSLLLLSLSNMNASSNLN